MRYQYVSILVFRHNDEPSAVSTIVELIRKDVIIFDSRNS